MQRFADSQSGETKRKSSRGASKAKRSSGKSSSFSLWGFLSGNKMIVCYGILLLLFSILLFISIFSFYFNAHENVSYVVGDGALDAPNLAKGVGASLSYFFIQYFFGVASIGFPFLILLYGIRLVSKKSLMPLGKTTFAVIMTMAWLSITLGLIGYNTDNSFLAGNFGNFICQFLVDKVGMIFTVLIDIALFFLILIFCYDVSLAGLFGGIQQWMVNIRERKSEKRQEMVRQTMSSSRSQHEDQPDLYITDHGALSKEYATKTYDLVDNKEPEDQNVGNEDIFSSEQVFDDLEQSGDIPFEIVNMKGDAEPVVEDAERDDDLELLDDVEEEPEHATTPEEVRNLEPYDPRKELSHFEFPPVDLLKDYPSTASTEELIKKELLETR